MLIRHAEVDGELCDVRLKNGHIAQIETALAASAGEQVIEANGCALLPGLHDHHIHLQATAAAMQSVRCGPPEVNNLDELTATLNSASGTDWLRGVGYHDSIGAEIDRNWLDENGPARPIRIQHRGGRMWVLNSRAIEAISLDAPADGRLIDRDAGLRTALSSTRPDLSPLVQHLLSRGVTGITETTPDNDRVDFVHLAGNCGPLRLLVMGGADLHGAEAMGRAHVGPLKLHYHDHNLPSLDELAAEIADAHAHGRNAAMHCVTRAEIMLGLAAFEQAGVLTGDRLEHGAIADPAIVEGIARLGLTVVTQPHFVTERTKAYLAEVEPDELPHLWPLRRFIEEGVSVAAGSDAPFGRVDPWRAMASAVSRPIGLSPEESVEPETALALYTKPVSDAGAAPRKVAIGEMADLCLIDRTWSDAARDFAEVKVRGTWIAGEYVYNSTSSTKPHANAV